MSAAEIAAVVTSACCLAAVVVVLVALASLRREVDRLRRTADDLTSRTVPLVADAHRVVEEAATEMERVGAVLDSTDAVHATVDSASRLTYRAFANPVVKVLAVRAGAATGLRRLAAPDAGARPSAPTPVGTTRDRAPSTNGHRSAGVGRRGR